MVCTIVCTVVFSPFCVHYFVLFRGQSSERSTPVSTKRSAMRRATYLQVAQRRVRRNAQAALPPALPKACLRHWNSLAHSAASGDSPTLFWHVRFKALAIHPSVHPCKTRLFCTPFSVSSKFPQNVILKWLPNRKKIYPKSISDAACFRLCFFT